MLAYDVGLKNGATYAGILVENAGLSQAVGGEHNGNSEDWADFLLPEMATWSVP